LLDDAIKNASIVGKPLADAGLDASYARDLRGRSRQQRVTGGGTVSPGVAYVCAGGRTASQPITHLSGFRDVLQVDGYAGYKALSRQGEVQLAFCWSHVRRGFYDLDGPIAAEVLTRIAGLYRIKAEIRGRPADERCAVRRARSRPILAAMKPWL
jgi:transposase